MSKFLKLYNETLRQVRKEQKIFGESRLPGAQKPGGFTDGNNPRPGAFVTLKKNFKSDKNFKELPDGPKKAIEDLADVLKNDDTMVLKVKRASDRGGEKPYVELVVSPYTGNSITGDGVTLPGTIVEIVELDGNMPKLPKSVELPNKTLLKPEEAKEQKDNPSNTTGLSTGVERYLPTKNTDIKP